MPILLQNFLDTYVATVVINYPLSENIMTNAVLAKHSLVLISCLLWHTSILRPRLLTIYWLQLLHEGCRTCLTNHMGSTTCHIMLLAINSLGVYTHTHRHTHTNFLHKSNFKKSPWPMASTHLVENGTIFFIYHWKEWTVLYWNNIEPEKEL